MRNSFGSLKYVQVQPWRVRYLTTDELAELTHEAESKADDLTVIAIDDEITRRGGDHREFYREAYLRTHPKPKK